MQFYRIWVSLYVIQFLLWGEALLDHWELALNKYCIIIIIIICYYYVYMHTYSDWIRNNIKI